jgi:hypothetical protein
MMLEATETSGIYEFPDTFSGPVPATAPGLLLDFLSICFYYSSPVAANSFAAGLLYLGSSAPVAPSTKACHE